MSLRLATAGFLVLLLAPYACPQITFASHVDYNVGAPSNAMASADFNGDGYPDIAVAVLDSSTGYYDQLVVLINNGDGTFGTPVVYSLPNAISSAFSVLAADVNGDGYTDLIVGMTSTSYSFYVLINNGDGTFQAPASYSDNPEDNTGLSGWAVGDFFAHGLYDIAINRVGLFGVSEGVDVFKNNGDGTFTYVLNTGMGLDEYGLWVADVNGDGLADLISPGGACGSVSGTTACMGLGNGDGTLGPVTGLALNGGPVAVADIGSPSGPPDGFPDVIGNNYGGVTIDVLLNSGNGTGSFNPEVNNSASLVGYPGFWIILGDFKGDGLLHLATTISSYACGSVGDGGIALDLMVNTGGGFTSGNGFVNNVATNPFCLSSTSTAYSGAGIAIDLNGDGWPDIVSSDPGQSSIHMMINQGGQNSNNRPVQVSPPTLSFPPLTITRTSTVRTLTLNYLSGNGFLDISNVGVSGDFAVERNACPSTLAAGVSCPIRLIFTPTATGTRAGTLTITDNQAGSPHTVNISGTGKNPAVTFSALSLFGNQLIGTTSTAKKETIRNSGIGDLVIGTVSASGDFSTSADTCSGQTIHQGKACTLNVAFTPSVAGTINGILTVTDDALTSPQVLSLTGTGQNPFSVSPSLLSFGSVSVGTISAAKILTLTNNSPNTLAFGVPASGDFSAVPGGGSPCTNATPPQSSCTIAVTFGPTQNGSIIGSVSVVSSGGGYTLSLPVSLSGTGTGGATAPLTFSPSILKFAPQVIQTSSSPLTVTATNRSSGTVTIQNLSNNSYDYGLESGGPNPCGGALAPKGTCTFLVTFGPSGLGNMNGGITITTDNKVSPQVYGLTATGILPVTFSPTSLRFAAQTVGTTSAPQTVTMTNNQTATLNIEGIQGSGEYSAVVGGANPCGSTLAPQSSCTFTVTFTPSKTGTIPGVVTVTHNAVGSPQEVKLTGTGQ